MRSKKLKTISKSGYVMMLAAGLMIPGMSNAAIVTGQTSVSLGAIDITLTMRIDDTDPTSRTEISVKYPVDRWLGITFGDPPSHDGSYGIVSWDDPDPAIPVDVYEINQRTTTGRPIEQSQQNLTVESFTIDNISGVATLEVSRLSTTPDPDDFVFTTALPELDLQYALGFVGFDPDVQHELRGNFPVMELTPIPVPAALPLLASGLVALGLFARRKKA